MSSSFLTWILVAVILALLAYDTASGNRWFPSPQIFPFVSSARAGAFDPIPPVK